jgi:putative restriction endonuclease
LASPATRSFDGQRWLTMGINLVVAVTDDDWFEMLRRQSMLNEVNFWAPSAATFRALQPGEMFLFKLHAPRHVIVGGGIFAYANALPCSLAWAAFGEANGARSVQEMRTRIARYRRTDPHERSDFAIGCRILTQPFFFDEPDWISVPPSWSPNIVSFKTYNTGNAEGMVLWEAVNDRLNRLHLPVIAEDGARFGEPPHSPPAWSGCLPRAGHGHLPSAVRCHAGGDPAGSRSCAYPAVW